MRESASYSPKRPVVQIVLNGVRTQSPTRGWRFRPRDERGEGMRARVEGDCHRRQFPGQSDAHGTDSYDGEVSSVYDSGLRDPNPSNGHRCRRRHYHPPGTTDLATLIAPRVLVQVSVSTRENLCLAKSTSVAGAGMLLCNRTQHNGIHCPNLQVSVSTMILRDGIAPLIPHCRPGCLLRLMRNTGEIRRYICILTDK